MILYELSIKNCQARVRSPKVKTKRTWADTKITWASESVQSKFDKMKAEDKQGFTGTLICLHLDLMRYPDMLSS